MSPVAGVLTKGISTRSSGVRGEAINGVIGAGILNDFIVRLG